MIERAIALTDIMKSNVINGRICFITFTAD